MKRWKQILTGTHGHMAKTKKQIIEDLKLIEETKDKNTIIVINKIDLDKKIDISSIKNIKNQEIVYINTLDKEGILPLIDKIKEMFNLEKIEKSNYNYITNTRQLSKIKECLNIINDIKQGLELEVGLDMLEMDLKTIWTTLGTIIGEFYEEELLDELFSKFCVGK